MGTEYFLNGDKYKGLFENSLPIDGYGEYYYKNGSFYKGTFKEF